MADTTEKKLTKAEKLAAKIAPMYFEHPSTVDERTDKKAIVAAPAEMEKDLIGRGFRPSTVEAFNSQEGIEAPKAEEPKKPETAK